LPQRVTPDGSANRPKIGTHAGAIRGKIAVTTIGTVDGHLLFPRVRRVPGLSSSAAAPSMCCRGGTVINPVDSGTMNVDSGGIGSNTVIDSGGSESVLSGGTEIGATVHDSQRGDNFLCPQWRQRNRLLRRHCDRRGGQQRRVPDPVWRGRRGSVHDRRRRHAGNRLGL
jgi:autotransporter passenger strand-loop-strand repeat protein